MDLCMVLILAASFGFLYFLIRWYGKQLDRQE